ncbi:peptidase C14, caspase catalytic subunit p20 [Paracoccus sp. MKU1]|nr:peptidase C14, caspase catalytic subunit p20 [Paracoccus sp. MKU1]
MPSWCARSGFRPGPALAALLCALVAALLMAAQAVAAPRVALVIGNAAYSGVPALDNPANDAEDMTAALRDLGFQVILGIDSDQAQMRALIDQFGAAAQTAEVALFYYAGHAFQVADQNYLLPRDFRLERLDRATARTVALDEALKAMAAAPGVKIVLLDACGDNPLRLPGGGSGLARIGSPADFLIAYATQPGAVAFDGAGRNGTFTEALLSHIHTPAQDIGEMMIAVRKDVMARTGGQQIPWDASALTRRFRFADGPPTASPETLFYQVAVRAADPALLRLYLQRYPNGSHVGEVLALLAQDPARSGQARRSMGPEAEGAAGEQLWDLARRSRLKPLLESYARSYPKGPHIGEARRLLAELSAETDPGPARRCELLATHPRDGTETTPGVSYELLAQNAVEAMRACEEAGRLHPRQAKYVALLARATAAAGLRAEAVALYERAAERGDLRAMVSLALLKETGDGVAPDPAGALALYKRAAAAGSADAAINLAVTLLDSRRAQDQQRGIALMQQASQAGSPIATFNLGVLAQEGRFGDPGDARTLFERAAREGEPRGHRAAAVLLDEGRGLPRDPSRAAVQLLLGVASDDGGLLRELAEQGGNWNPETLSALQRRLARAGLYQGAADGKPGPALNQALELWRNGGFNATALSG